MPAIDLVLRTPADDGDRKLLADVHRVGWHLVGVDAEADPALPPFMFSVGMYYSLGCPEFVVVGLPHAAAMGLINNIGDAVRGGRRVECDVPQSDFVANFDIVLKPVEETNYREYLGFGLWFYKLLPHRFPCWQVFWPDREGRFPWNAGCQPAIVALQTDLTNPDRSGKVS